MNDKNNSGESQDSLKSFSQREENKPIIFVDDREKKVLNYLENKELNVRVNRLELADFLLSKQTAVERKTTSDFVNSIIDQRLFDQLKNIDDQFDNPILIIEGKDLYLHRDVHPNAIRGSLSSLALDYKIPVLWTSSSNETAEMLVSLLKREQKEKKREVAIRGEKAPKRDKDLQEYIVAGLPDTSNKLARRFLDKFGKVKDVFSASQTELQQVKGIGQVKSEKIWEILNKEYKGQQDDKD